MTTKPQTRSTGAWQPIDTAPLDTHDVLGGFAPGGRQLVVHREEGSDRWLALDRDVVHPTHFQELGPGPTADDVIPPAPPVLTALTPASAALGDPSFTLHVTGTGFLADSVILWNGAPEPTTVLSPTELTTQVDMSTAAAAIDIPVTVQNEGGAPSNALTFSLTDPAARAAKTGPARK